MSLRSVLAAVLLSVPFGTIAQEPDPEDHDKIRMIVVSGTGQVSGVPDTAEINIGITAEADTAKAAVETNNQQMRSLLDALKQTTIAENDLQTSSFNVSPQYHRAGSTNDESPKINGYRVSNQVQIRIREIETLGSVLDKVVAAGANQINSISFSIDKSETLMDEARGKAIRDAKRKAGLIAKEAGVTLGAIAQIREHSPVDRPFPQRKMAMADTRSTVPIQTGEQTLTAHVQISFRFEQ